MHNLVMRLQKITNISLYLCFQLASLFTVKKKKNICSLFRDNKKYLKKIFTDISSQFN